MLLPGQTAAGDEAEKAEAQDQASRGGRLGNGAELEGIDRRRVDGIDAGKRDYFRSATRGERPDDELADATDCVCCIVVEGNGVRRSCRSPQPNLGGGARSIQPPLKFVLLTYHESANRQGERVVFVGRHGGAE